MEFGLFLGGFVHRDLAAANPNAEHDRLMSEVELCEVGDQHNWKYAWFTEHHFLEEYSHISANEVLMPWVLARTERMHVGSGIINVTPPVNHPARVAERVAMMDHVSSGRFEFGTGRGSSTTEMGGFGITDPEITRDMYDEAIGEFKKMWRDEHVLVRRPVLHDARAQRAAEAVREAAPADVGRGRQPRARSRRPRRWGSACSASPVARPRRWRRSSRLYKKTIVERGAGRRVRQRQHRGHDELHVPRGPRRGARLDDALGQRPPADARVPLPRHVPEAAVRARVAAGDPRPDARADRRGVPRPARASSARPTTAPRACRSGTTSASTS